MGKSKDGFLSARALGLTRLERTALVGVLEKIEAGWFTPASVAGSWETGVPKNFFSMGTWFESHAEPVLTDCGSVGCIGGWADALYGTEFNVTDSPRGLNDLFFPTRQSSRTLEDAGRALRRYLETGAPAW